MNFLTQKLANSFPMRSTVRRDQSSSGQRLFSCFADLLDGSMVDVVKLSKSFKVFNRDIGVGELYKIDLLEDDYLQESENLVGSYIVPEVTGTIGLDDYILTQVTNTEDFLYGLTTRLSLITTKSLSDELLFTNDTDKYPGLTANGDHLELTDQTFAERLKIKIYDTTLYKSDDDLTEYKPFNGYSFVKIIGRDKFLNQIEEYIQVNRDGEYLTDQLFRQIDSFEYDGFIGNIEVSFTEAKLSTSTVYDIVKTNQFHTVSNWIKTGLCEIEMSSAVIEFQGGPETLYYLNIYGRFIIDESALKNGNGYEGDLIRTKIASILLVDQGMNFYTPVDYFLSPINSRIYILDDTGKVHISSVGLSPFLEQGDNRSTNVPLVSDPLSQRVGYAHDVRIRCRRRQDLGEIINWEIKAVAPSGEVYLLKYSRPSGAKVLEWLDSGQHNGSYLNAPIVDQNILESNSSSLIKWTDFNYNLTIDEIGQWELYTTVYYINNSSNTHKTSIMCEYLESEVIIDTGLNDVTGIFLSEDNLIGIVKNGNSINYYQENLDCFIADVINQRLICKDQYDEVDVTYA